MSTNKNTVDLNVGDKKTIDLAGMAAMCTMLAAGKQGDCLAQTVSYGFFGLMIGGGLGYLNHILAVVIIIISAIVFFA